MNHWETLEREAREIVVKTYESLPEELQNPASAVPVILESAPTEAMQEEGIEADVLGLFVGESHDAFGEDLNPMPGQILLFLENIWEFAEGDLKRYREEVSITLLHELGHYLGLDEQDMFDRGLD